MDGMRADRALGEGYRPLELKASWETLRWLRVEHYLDRLEMDGHCRSRDGYCRRQLFSGRSIGFQVAPTRHYAAEVMRHESACNAPIRGKVTDMTYALCAGR